MMLLEANRLGKTYHKRPVVRDLSLKVESGEVVGLLGPNGAGKTTGFYMITGLVKPDYGTVMVNGKDVSLLPVYQRARAGIGYLPQETSIFRGMTVEDNIKTALEITEPDAETRRRRLEELLAEFSVSHLRASTGVTLSGGERRRVEIARALAADPSFMLLDEPLAGIDPLVVSDIKDLIMRLKERGLGVLITDHNVRDALDMIDRAYIIYEGRIIKEGTPEDIVNDPQVRKIYLGNDFSL